MQPEPGGRASQRFGGAFFQLPETLDSGFGNNGSTAPFHPHGLANCNPTPGYRRTCGMGLREYSDFRAVPGSGNEPFLADYNVLSDGTISGLILEDWE